MKKIVFVSTAISSPYVIKKVKAFRKAGYETVFYSYNRGDKFERDISPEELGEVVDLGYLPSGSGYLKKLWNHIWSLKRVFKENSADCLLIIFMFDLALINLLFYGRQYIYHISDITYARVNNKLVVSFFRKVDQALVKHSKLTIITSLGFQKFLFPDGSCSEKFAEVPNLLQEDNPYTRNSVEYFDNIGNLSFGFIGLNRYVSPLCIAKVVGEKFSQHKFYFYGNGAENMMADIYELTEKYSNIFAKGRFNSSKELGDIYNNIDILICCYDVINTNVRVAEPNKLYEAIFFNKPIVVSAGTFLEERVKSLGIGYGVESMNPEAVEKFIDSLTVEDLNGKLDAISKIKTEELIDNGQEVVELILKGNGS